MKKKRNNCLLVFILASVSCFAQTEGYRFRAEIEPVKESGFYNIILTPALNAHLKTDFSDLRIINSTGKWVPHLLRHPATEQTNHDVLWDLPIVSNKNDFNVTELIARAGNQKISNLRFTLRNTDVERFGNLTGSDDSIHWFIINDSMLLQPEKREPTESEFAVDFPSSTYQFYKLSIANRGKAPYAIKAASTSSPFIKPGPGQSLLYPIQNPAARISQQDSGNISYIRVEQDARFHIDQIDFKLSGSQYYNRLVQLYVPAPGRATNRSAGRFIAGFTMSNNRSLQFKVPVFNDSLFYLAILNEDNLPLKVDEIKSYATLRLATVYLEKNSQYRIIMGNASAMPPRYDLALNDVDLTKVLPVAATRPVIIFQHNKLATSTLWQDSKLLLWLCILAAVALLCFFTFRLIKDIGKSEQSNS